MVGTQLSNVGHSNYFWCRKMGKWLTQIAVKRTGRQCTGTPRIEIEER